MMSASVRDTSKRLHRPADLQGGASRRQESDFDQVNAQAKLCRVVEGEVLDVSVDVGFGSPPFRKWTSVLLSDFYDPTSEYP